MKVELRQRQLEAHLRGQRSLDALFALGEAMAGVEGPKTVVLISGGMPMPDIRGAEAFSRLEAAFAAGQASLYTLYLERSFFGQAKEEVSPTQVEDDALERDGIENATSVTGGTLLLGIGTLDQYFDRVVTEMSGSYLIGIEVAPADRDGRTHQVDVKVARRGLEVRARKRYVIEPARAVAATAKKAAGRDEKKPAAASVPVTVEMLTPEVRVGGGTRRAVRRGVRDRAVRAGGRRAIRAAVVHPREDRQHGVGAHRPRAQARRNEGDVGVDARRAAGDQVRLPAGESTGR